MGWALAAHPCRIAGAGEVRVPEQPAKASAVGLASQIEPSLARPDGRMRPSLHVPCWVSAALSSAALREPAWSRSPSKPAKASAVGLASQIEPSLARPEGRMRPSLHVPCWVSAALSSAKLIEHLFSAAWAVRAFLPPRSLRTAAEIAEKGAHYIDSVRKNVTPE